MGAVDLLDVSWDPDAQTLSGKSAVVKGDPYTLAVHLPNGFELKSATMDNKDGEVKAVSDVIEISCKPTVTGEIEWHVAF